MAEWKLEQEEYYYKIYDTKRELVGYFQPDFGKIYPEEKEEEIIQQMLKNQDHVHGGLLYLPMMKLNIRDDADYELDQVRANLEVAIERAEMWKEHISEMSSITSAWARRSHTDPDMLAVLMNVKFSGPMRLNKDDLLIALQPTLDSFAEKELL